MVRFQSLFWWKYCPGYPIPDVLLFNHIFVSILVLVEVLPWASATARTGPRSMGFNPCSGGSIALGENLRDYIVEAVNVSILVLVEVLPWAGGHANLEQGSPVVFQSLFWWKYCPGYVPPFTGQARKSFNPCSGGSIALGPRPITLHAHLVESGFNPCSGGSIALGSISDGNASTDSVVSILVLVEVLPWVFAGNVHHSVAGNLFQSLFWWKYCPGQLVQNLFRFGIVFQSLFWWKYCPGPNLRGVWPKWALVSILVLVEVLPWVAGVVRREAANLVSILVLVEVLPWDIYAGVPGLFPGVSILVLVEVLPWASNRNMLRSEMTMFQSLFWWKYCPGDMEEKPVVDQKAENAFQSLFWWKYCPGTTSTLSASSA